MEASQSVLPGTTYEDSIRQTQRLLVPALARPYAVAEPVFFATLRIAFGIVMLSHGIPKALRTSHGSMADPWSGSINLIQNVMGLPFAPQLAFLIMLLETLGAAMLILGLWTRPVAFLIAGQMIGICFALGPNWVWVDRGIEFPFLMGALALYIAVRGGGRYSIDSRLKLVP